MTPDPLPPEDGRRWTLYVCDECGWTILDENASGEGQPCEAWLIDSEIAEHGPTRRVEVIAAHPDPAGTDPTYPKHTPESDERLREALEDEQPLIPKRGEPGYDFDIWLMDSHLGSRGFEVAGRLRTRLRRLYAIERAVAALGDAAPAAVPPDERLRSAARLAFSSLERWSYPDMLDALVALRAALTQPPEPDSTPGEGGDRG